MKPHKFPATPEVQAVVGTMLAHLREVVSLAEAHGLDLQVNHYTHMRDVVSYVGEAANSIEARQIPVKIGDLVQHTMHGKAGVYYPGVLQAVSARRVFLEVNHRRYDYRTGDGEFGWHLHPDDLARIHTTFGPPKPAK